MFEVKTKTNQLFISQVLNLCKAQTVRSFVELNLTIRYFNPKAMRTTSVVSTVVSLALLSREVLATPPACLLACVAEVSKGSSSCDSINQVSCIGESNGGDVKNCLDSRCPNGDADTAYDAFKQAVSDQGSDVDDSTSSSSSSASSSTVSSTSSASSSTESSSVSSSATSEQSSSTESSSEAPSSTSSEAPSSTSSEAPSTTSEAPSTTSESSSTTSDVPSTSEAPSSTISSTFYEPSTSSSSSYSLSVVPEGAGNILGASGSIVFAAVAALLI